MAIKINLLEDHGKKHTPAESYIVGLMLENAYRAGHEAGMKSAQGLPPDWDLLALCARWKLLVARFKAHLDTYA